MVRRMNQNEITERVESAKIRSRLAWYADEIAKRARSLASIFIELRNDPLKPWRLDYASYEDYCEQVWNMSTRRQQQIIAGESVKALLSSEAPDLKLVLESMPERQLRELAETPPEKRVEVLREAVASRQPMTAKVIKRSKVKVINAATGQQEPEPELCPTCKRPL